MMQGYLCYENNGTRWAKQRGIRNSLLFARSQVVKDPKFSNSNPPRNFSEVK